MIPGRLRAAVWLAACAIAMANRAVFGGEPVALEIAPSLLELSAAPGGRLERLVTLVNGGDRAIQVAVSRKDWAMAPDGEISFLDAGRQQRSCADWIRVEPEQVSVPAHGRARVRVAISLPAEGSGTYWAVVFFAVNDAMADGKSRPSPNLAARVGLTVYATIEGTEREDLAVPELSAWQESLGASLRAGLENRGNTAIRARLTWQIKSSVGGFIRTYTTPSVVVLPNSRRNVSVQVDEKIPPGAYLVTVMATWGARRWASRDAELAMIEKPIPPETTPSN